MPGYTPQTRTVGFYWHVRRTVLLEWCYGYEERVQGIRTRKGPREQALHLRLLAPVQGALPSAVIEAGAALNMGIAAYDNAWVAFNQSYEAVCKADAAIHSVLWLLLRPNKTRTTFRNAGDAYLAADAALREARRELNGDWTALNKAITSNWPAIEALHTTECPNCPWGGGPIFPAA